MEEPKYKDIENRRLRKVIDVLKARGLEKSYRKISMRVGATHPHCLLDMANGKRRVLLKVVKGLLEVYAVNPLYLFGKSDQMFGESGPQSPYMKMNKQRAAEAVKEIRQLLIDQNLGIDPVEKSKAINQLFQINKLLNDVKR